MRLAAEFADADALLRAIRRLRAAGHRALDAYTPHPLVEVEAELALGRSRINWMIFPLAIGGAAFAFALQSWCNAVDYPINVGGRPPYSWVTSIPITFETGILATALSSFFILFWVLGLPRLTHPLFKLDGFERASLDRFWLTVEDADENTPRELAEALSVQEWSP
jgi:Alternative complex III, ActD subunit